MITAVVQFPLPPSVSRDKAAERYGAEPVITYFDTPVVVDNATAEISSDS